MDIFITKFKNCLFYKKLCVTIKSNYGGFGMKINFRFLTAITILCLALLVPYSVSADEGNTEAEELSLNKEVQEEVLENVNEEENKEEVQEEQNNEDVTNEADKANSNSNNTFKSSGSSVDLEEHKVSCITTKVDEKGNPLSGAVLQILDSNGNVVDEWTTDGEEHETMLPEGEYTLHEVSAPKGYMKAPDKKFTVKVEVYDLDAGVDFSETPCQHYGGTPLYYVEMKGEKSEVYCINQDWETPDDNSVYDGQVITPSDIKDYTKQTVYVDAHQNKDKVDVSDQSLSSAQLYNKILDIIYHHQLHNNPYFDNSQVRFLYLLFGLLLNRHLYNF